MKILQIASALNDSGGIEKFILHLAVGLRERGHCVEIAAVPDSWVWQRAQERGFVVVPLRVRSRHDLRALSPYVRALRRGQYDLINTHYSVDYLIPALAARRVGQRNVVLTRHVVRPWRGLKRYLYGAALYDHILAVSDAVRNALLAGGIAPARVTRVHGAVPIPDREIAPARLREELNLPAETALIGIVSRIAPEKGHRYLLQAMRAVDPRAVCLVVGEGPDRAAVEAAVRENGLQERVRFLGWRGDREAVMAALDVVVQPSLGEEACSEAILEGMALGRPMVVTESGGNAELVAHGESGLVVPKRDAAVLAAALDVLVRDPDLRARMGAAGRQRQQERFSLQAMARGTEQVYCRLLA